MKRIKILNFYKSIFPLWLVDILFRPRKIDKKSDIYETKYGHCPFCGTLECHDGCF